MAVRKRGDAWEVDLQIQGQRVRQSLGPGSTKSEAKELEAKIRREYRAHTLGKSPDYSLEEAVTRWLKEVAAYQKSYEKTLSHIRAIRSYLAGRKLTEVHKVAEEYKQDALARGYKPATVNRRIEKLRRVANTAYKRWEWLSEPLGTKIQMASGEETRHVYLTRAEVEEIAFLCRRRLVSDVIRVAAYTGLRHGEILRIGPENIRNGMIEVGPHTKNGEPRNVPIHPRIQEAVRRLPYPHASRTLDKWWMKARDAAGFPDTRFHDLRHTMASWLIQNGASMAVVRDILGHSNITVTDRYSHLRSQDHRDAVNSIGGNVSRERRKRKGKSRSGGG